MSDLMDRMLRAAADASRSAYGPMSDAMWKNNRWQFTRPEDVARVSAVARVVLEEAAKCIEALTIYAPSVDGDMETYPSLDDGWLERDEALNALDALIPQEPPHA